MRKLVQILRSINVSAKINTCEIMQFESFLPKNMTRKLYLGANYMEIFNPGWNFNSVYRVEISSRLSSKLLFKMTLRLCVKFSARYTELKFQLGLANPRWNSNPGWKFQIFHIIDFFSNPGWKFGTTHARIPCLCRWRQYFKVP